MTGTADGLNNQVYRVFIKATAERIWEAITTPEWTRQYFYEAAITADGDTRRLVSVGPDGAKWMDEEIDEYDPPRRLVHTWRSLYDPDMATEQASRVTWEIEAQDGGVCMLTVVHDHLEGAPRTAASVSGAGWMFVLCGLKTLLETGVPMAAGSWAAQ